MMNSVIQSVQKSKVFEISLIDSITMSIIVDLTRQSLIEGNKVIDIPDFTNGNWIFESRLWENCIYLNNFDIIHYGNNVYYSILKGYGEIIQDINNFNLFHYSETFSLPLRYTYDTNDINNTFSISDLNTINIKTYLSFNDPDNRDTHYLIISSTENIKRIDFYFKIEKQVYEIQNQSYWCYLFDGRNESTGNVPGPASGTYIAFRKNSVTVGSNIEKIILDDETISENIGSNMNSKIEKNKWYRIRIYLKDKITDDISLFSRYNNREDLDGSIANIRLYDEEVNLIKSYDFDLYNNENKFYDSITKTYDLKVVGFFEKGVIHDLSQTNNLYNSRLEDLNNNTFSDIIVFFTPFNI